MTVDESLGDTLRLVNQNNLILSKDFSSRFDGDIYRVTENLGNTKMTLNVKGIAGGEVETLDLNGKQGFILDRESVALNLRDVRFVDNLSSNKIGINVKYNRSRVWLTNVILDMKIKGDSLFTLTTDGETRFNQTVENARIMNNGTLLSGLDKLITSEVTNNGTFITSGSLNQYIAGNGTMYLNGSLKMGTDAGIEGTLSMNNQEITVSSGSITSHTIGKMTGYGLLNIDINLSGELADKIITSKTSDGQITLSSVNILDSTTREINKDMNLQVLKGGVVMTLSDEVRTMFDNNEYIIDQGEGYTEYGKLSLSEDGHSIVVTSVRTETTRTAAVLGARRMMLSSRPMTTVASADDDVSKDELALCFRTGNR